MKSQANTETFLANADAAIADIVENHLPLLERTAAHPTIACAYKDVLEEVLAVVREHGGSADQCQEAKEELDWHCINTLGFNPEGTHHNDCGVTWVAVYKVSRCYGGGEEGGWYYDAGELVESHVYGTRELAVTQAEHLRNGRFADDAKHELSSVLSEGNYRVWLDDEQPAPHFPTERPFYE